MQVILLERVAKLGHMGESVKVKDGYARNFLLPRGKALRANKANEAKFEAQKADLVAKNAVQRQSSEAEAAKLKDKFFTIIRQAGESGQLYGSVSPRENRARAGAFMAFLLLLPAAAFLWEAWQKFEQPIPPNAFSLSITALGALAVNVSCALLLSRYHKSKGSLTKAAFLSARNDAIANVAIIASGIYIAYVWHSFWPDMIVGAGIAIMNLDAAREVWEAARDENKQPNS